MLTTKKAAVVIIAVIVAIAVTLIILKRRIAKQAPQPTTPATQTPLSPAGGSINQYGYFVPEGGWGFTNYTDYITQEETSALGGWSNVKALKDLSRKKDG